MSILGLDVQMSDKQEEIEKLRVENTALRSILAFSNVPCIYCGLSLSDQGKCAFGFPGCARADDQLLGLSREVNQE